jgi:hypothetical protein
LPGGNEIKKKEISDSQFSGHISNSRTLEYAAGLLANSLQPLALLPPEMCTIFKIFITSIWKCIKSYLNTNLVYTTNIKYAQFHQSVPSESNLHVNKWTNVHWDGYTEGHIKGNGHLWIIVKNTSRIYPYHTDKPISFIHVISLELCHTHQLQLGVTE